jgi:hypothetical protein
MYNDFDFKIWRDCLGIEPSGDGTRLPSGFEDRGMHQQHNQPHIMNKLYYGVDSVFFQVSRSGHFYSEKRYYLQDLNFREMEEYSFTFPSFP